MRILHTSDWHLGKQMRGLSRQAEFEAVVDEVVSIARDEAVDAFVLAGDVFDTFSPPPEAEKLFYDALGRLLADGIQVVVIAGNHDHASRLDALAGVLRRAGIHALGLPRRTEDCLIELESRDGEETANFIALPWIPERHILDFEDLAAGPDDVSKEYSERLAVQIGRLAELYLDRRRANVFIGHMLIDGAVVSDNGGERRLHVGQNFAVKAQALPQAHYVALGHVHRHQQISAAAPAFYSGSLLQLDFGEAGQEKYVNLVEARPNLPAEVRKVALSAGRSLRSVSLRLDELAAAVERFGDDYLRVTVELEQPMSSLYQRVRELLPNAVEVTPHLPVQEALIDATEQRRGLTPEELFARYYRGRYGSDVAPALLAAFNETYAEVQSNAAS